ncbi:MAG: DUF3576 domain-containing protein [Alphaproteobacteria bacterium]|nr:DUF3576 domain-containing protein [Alphaproteobacteria bacterium]MBU1527185.1 DUF3576 domain-containing protein [Alphaproteobacteria bacterium]MBU2117940.1 DUF3576 domain-containing protein [Alphaproteobacteria bacterium]MBU2351129.1 DUF3576 domain-containing protein [Alphaproteobacteria bacterium]MBU2382372.1 DUF3576 domain-containing protein [Alphaproteobacteria bacterium]
MLSVRGAATILIVSSLGLTACSAERPFGPVLSDVLPGGPTTRAAAESAQLGIGVNAYLWRATLDTLSFMPLSSADPWGGVINYDWYSDPRTPDERFKATVFILDTRLRADALNVALTKQVRDASGQWVAAAVDPQTETDLENAILTKARQFNLADAR